MESDRPSCFAVVLGAAQVGSFELRAVQVGKLQVRVPEVGAAQVHPRQGGAAQCCAFEVYPAQVSVLLAVIEDTAPRVELTKKALNVALQPRARAAGGALNAGDGLV